MLRAHSVDGRLEGFACWRCQSVSPEDWGRQGPQPHSMGALSLLRMLSLRRLTLGLSRTCGRPNLSELVAHPC